MYLSLSIKVQDIDLHWLQLVHFFHGFQEITYNSIYSYELRDHRDIYQNTW